MNLQQTRLQFIDQNDNKAQLINGTNYIEAFKNLYYHLYSNSNSSRAERIVSDLSNLLLCKIIAERNGYLRLLNTYLAGNINANDVLLPLLTKHYPNLIANDDKFTLDDQSLKYALAELIPLSFVDAPSHVLGEAFQALIGPRLRGDKGQFFTPKTLVGAMIKIIDPKMNSKIVDPACGTGGFLTEANSYQQQKYKNTKYQGSLSTLIGMDKDKDLCRLAEAMLEIIAPKRSNVLNVNSLDIISLQKLSKEASPFNADYVLTNPPFGSKIKITDKKIIEQYDLGYRWTKIDGHWSKQNKLRDAQDPQVLFLELCIKLLKNDGLLGIVLPEGMFGNPGMGYVWDFLKTQGRIIAVMDCPRTTFQPSTDTKTNVLFFEKNQINKDKNENNKTWISVALFCGHDRRGRTTKNNGDEYIDDFRSIAEEYNSREFKSNFWQHVNISDPYYLVPRYYQEVKFNGETKKYLTNKVVSIGEMINNGFIKIRKGHEVGAEAYGSGEIPFIRTSDISNYEITIDQSRGINEEVFNQYAKLQKLSTGDILMVSDGRYRIGRTAILQEHNYPCVVQSHIRIISTTQKSPLDSFELLFLLNLPSVQHQIRNLVFIQSTLGTLGGRINQIKIPLPNKNNIWSELTTSFRSMIEARADLLKKLKQFEHPGYEL